MLMTALAMIIGMVRMALGGRRGRTERAAGARGDGGCCRDRLDAVFRPVVFAATHPWLGVGCHQSRGTACAASRIVNHDR
ncbi:MAG: hypothetical protein QM702_20640 [Rubrivivax sp.]